MQVVVSFSDTTFPDMLFVVTEDSLVEEVVEAAAIEWNVDVRFLELSFEGKVLPLGSHLVSNGIEVDSMLIISSVTWITKEILVNGVGRVELFSSSNQILYLATPTFANENGCLAFSGHWSPEMGNLCFGQPDPLVTCVAEDFLYESKVSSVDLPGLENVTHVGTSFLSASSSLTKLNLSSLSRVTSVGDNFLYRCESLTEVDLTGLTSVTSIGQAFICACYSIKHVNLSGLCNVTSVKSGFMASCRPIKRLDLTGLGNVTSIGDGFLSFSYCITSLNLQRLTSVTNVGEHFLFDLDEKFDGGISKQSFLDSVWRKNNERRRLN